MLIERITRKELPFVEPAADTTALQGVVQISFCEIRSLESNTVQVCSRKICSGKACCSKIYASEVYVAEICFCKIRIAEVWIDLQVPLSPLVPGETSFSENGEVLLIR